MFSLYLKFRLIPKFLLLSFSSIHRYNYFDITNTWPQAVMYGKVKSVFTSDSQRNLMNSPLIIQ